MDAKALPGRPFEKGHPGGPGRPKGSRNKLSEAFLADMYEDWEKHGKDVIVKVRVVDPAAYLRAVVATLPKDMDITVRGSLADLLGTLGPGTGNNPPLEE